MARVYEQWKRSLQLEVEVAVASTCSAEGSFTLVPFWVALVDTVPALLNMNLCAGTATRVHVHRKKHLDAYRMP